MFFFRSFVLSFFLSFFKAPAGWGKSFEILNYSYVPAVVSMKRLFTSKYTRAASSCLLGQWFSIYKLAYASSVFFFRRLDATSLFEKVYRRYATSNELITTILRIQRMRMCTRTSRLFNREGGRGGGSLHISRQHRGSLVTFEISERRTAKKSRSSREESRRTSRSSLSEGMDQLSLMGDWPRFYGNLYALGRCYISKQTWQKSITNESQNVRSRMCTSHSKPSLP